MVSDKIKVGSLFLDLYTCVCVCTYRYTEI